MHHHCWLHVLLIVAGHLLLVQSTVDSSFILGLINIAIFVANNRRKDIPNRHPFNQTKHMWPQIHQKFLESLLQQLILTFLKESCLVQSVIARHDLLDCKHLEHQVNNLWDILILKSVRSEHLLS